MDKDGSYLYRDSSTDAYKATLFMYGNLCTYAETATDSWRTSSKSKRLSAPGRFDVKNTGRGLASGTPSPTL